MAIGADHAGYPLKQDLIPYLESLGHSVLDLGTNSTAPVDYPDYSEAVGLAVLDGRAERGVLICGSGVGASVAANKLPGIRAGLTHDCYSAHQGVEDDNMNIVVFGARVIATELAKDLVAIYLKAVFSNAPRHVRRLEKIKALEVKYGHQS
ncbi:MAG TPA: RpiB/LacA/LacB family sugar-phosphate isomerase [Candidatus Acidoferrales bacterium]|nr:RpiB/LacA/LacB family sugar-phosphate isomerase [Candidatus Acidoferrales bacterium]